MANEHRLFWEKNLVSYTLIRLSINGVIVVKGVFSGFEMEAVLGGRVARVSPMESSGHS